MNKGFHYNTVEEPAQRSTKKNYLKLPKYFGVLASDVNKTTSLKTKTKTKTTIGKTKTKTKTTESKTKTKTTESKTEEAKTKTDQDQCNRC